MMAVGFSTTESLASPRMGLMTTPRGEVRTPAYLPFAARGAIGSLRPSDLRGLGAQALSVSLYGLLSRPGLDAIESLGGAHAFMAWDGPLLADPGDAEIARLGAPDAVPDSGRRTRGGQGRVIRLNERGVEFSSYVDGAISRLTPEDFVTAQRRMGADAGRSAWIEAERPPGTSVPNTGEWARRSLFQAEQVAFPLFVTLNGVAGMADAASEGAFGFARLAIDQLEADWWPASEHPRLVVGEQGPVELLLTFAAGADLVSGNSPLRAAARGIAFTRWGQFSLTNDVRTDDPRPLVIGCPCSTCEFAARGYLRHLFETDEMVAPTLLAQHNLSVMLRLERAAREWIADGCFRAEAGRFLADYRDDGERASERAARL